MNDINLAPDVLIYLGRSGFASGNIAPASAYIEEVLRVARDTGRKNKMTQAFFWLGEVFRYQEDYDKALSYHDEYNIPQRANPNCIHYNIYG